MLLSASKFTLNFTTTEFILIALRQKLSKLSESPSSPVINDKAINYWSLDIDITGHRLSVLNTLTDTGINDIGR